MEQGIDWETITARNTLNTFVKYLKSVKLGDQIALRKGTLFLGTRQTGAGR